MAMRQFDVKRIIAYSTMTHMAWYYGCCYRVLVCWFYVHSSTIGTYVCR